MERIIKEKNIDLSVGKVLDAVKTITTIRVKMPENEEIYTKTLINIGRYAHYLTSPMNRNDLGGALTKSGKRGGCAKTLFSTKSPLPHIAVAGVIFIFWMF